MEPCRGGGRTLEREEGEIWRGRREDPGGGGRTLEERRKYPGEGGGMTLEREEGVPWRGRREDPGEGREDPGGEEESERKERMERRPGKLGTHLVGRDRQDSNHLGHSSTSYTLDSNVRG